jgi:competence protein ComEC
MGISKIATAWEKGLGKVRQLLSRLPPKWVLVFLILAAALVWIAALTTPGDGRLEVSFFDVGQGDAILIQTPAGQQILIDGGPDSEKVCLELGERLSFWDKSIDLVVLTHPQDDHLVGLVEVLHRYKVGQILEPGFDYNTPAYEEWLRLIEEKEIKRTIARAGQRIDLGGGIELEVLHPQAKFLEGIGSDVNSNSIVLRLVWDSISFLLTADIEEGAERELLHQGKVAKSTVLKVAHHGSKSSTCEQFLAAVDPQGAVVSVGEDNPFDHPSPEVIQRLEDKVGKDGIYLTSQQGTITFTTDGNKLWVETES